MADWLVFLPVLVVLTAIAFLKGRAIPLSLLFTFVAYIGYYITYVVVQAGPGWLPLVQFFITLFILVLLVGSFGPKISRPTYLTVFALLLLFPLSANTVIPYIVAFVVGNIVATAVGVYKLRKHESATGEEPQSMKDIVVDASLDVGILTRQLPSGERMQDLDEYSDTLKTRMAPAYLTGAILGVLVSLIF